VRAYKKIGKKTYYSDYTTIKSKKAKVVSWYKKISKKISKKTKWIEVDLSKQVVYLHVGKEKIKKTYPCSTGKPGTPTPSGVFKITRKIKLHDMKGDWDPVKKEWGYVTKDVAWSTYFFANAAFHGAPWNRQLDIPVDEKRIPKSHGCVNLAIKNADYLYHWAPTGTLTIVHK
jgi:lipoprotein-anchoring transpeptidase ErfK/SrfK